MLSFADAGQSTTCACPRIAGRLLATALLLVCTSFAPARAQALPGLPQDQEPTRSDAGRTPAIEAMTTIGADGAGYMADPQPVHLASSSHNRDAILSGTTEAVLQCRYPLRPGCFTWRRVRIDAGELDAAIASAGATLTNFQNLDLFQDDAGGWHAALTIGVKSQAHPSHWTVIVHAHPAGADTPDAVPLHWAADTVLAGSFTHPVEGNYDAKYVEDRGRLYLLYVATIAARPALRNAIFLQPMQSPTLVAPTARILLLAPSEGAAELASERYANTPAKLVEAPYLSRVGDKYALVYSTGAYLTDGYKAAVAWSDNLLPPAGAQYRKVLRPDALGIWGQSARPEVQYLIQSEKPRWPNFTGRQVIGPGVAAAIEGPGGAWWLTFNGFAPDDMPPGPASSVDATHRRPFFVRMQANVPARRSVAQASDAELAQWLVPQSR